MRSPWYLSLFPHATPLHFFPLQQGSQPQRHSQYITLKITPHIRVSLVRDNTIWGFGYYFSWSSIQTWMNFKEGKSRDGKRNSKSSSYNSWPFCSHYSGYFSWCMLLLKSCFLVDIMARWLSNIHTVVNVTYNEYDKKKRNNVLKVEFIFLFLKFWKLRS